MIVKYCAADMAHHIYDPDNKIIRANFRTIEEANKAIEKFKKIGNWDKAPPDKETMNTEQDV